MSEAALQTRPPAILLMGPTAAGKTALAVALAQRLPLDIVSVDSALVYRGMNIGTAKPDAATLALAPHRLIDVCEPSEAYSAARFRADALREMAAITATGRIPLLVGGTMLYFRSLQRGLAVLPPADPDVRARLDAELRDRGLAALHRRLSSVDPTAAARIHPNDPQRTLRALEVWEITGRPLSVFHSEQPSTAFPYQHLKLVVAPHDRAELRSRISERFTDMIRQGLVAEVAGLLQTQGVHRDTPAMRAVGYRQVAEYLMGKWDEAGLHERAIIATAQLAKRQMTWLRSEMECNWLSGGLSDQLESALQLCREHLILHHY